MNFNSIFRRPLHRNRISNELLVEVPDENVEYLSKVLAIPGLFDYFKPNDIINFFHAFRELNGESNKPIIFKQTLIQKRFKNIKIKMGMHYIDNPAKPYQYKVNIDKNLPILHLDSDEMSIFIKQYGSILKYIEIINNFHEFPIFARQYEQYFYYSELFNHICNQLEAIIDRYKYSHIKLKYPLKLMRNAEIVLIKIILTDGLMQYLNNDDIFLFMQALKPTILFSKFVFTNLLFTHIKNQEKEFKSITIKFQNSDIQPQLSYSISNNQYFNMDKLIFNDIRMIVSAIGKHIQYMEYYHTGDFYEKNLVRRDSIMKLFQSSCPNIKTLKIGSNRVIIDNIQYLGLENSRNLTNKEDINYKIQMEVKSQLDRLKRKEYHKIGGTEYNYLISMYPFLHNINLQIFQNQTDLFDENDQIMLRKNLSELNRSLLKVDISNKEAFLILDPEHLRNILKLPHLNRLIMFSKYDIFNLFESILEIELTSIDEILHALEYLIIKSDKNEDTNHIEYFFKNISLLTNQYGRKPKSFRSLLISNYHFANCMNFGCSNYLQPRGLTLKDCTFDDMITDTVLKYFDQIEIVEIENTVPIKLSLFPNLSNVTNLIFKNCPLLTNDNLLLLYNICIHIEVCIFYIVLKSLIISRLLK